MVPSGAKATNTVTPQHPLLIHFELPKARARGAPYLRKYGNPSM